MKRFRPPAGQLPGSVLVAVGGRSSSSWQALDWAAAEASTRGCHLRILHVVRWPVATSDPFGEFPVLTWDEQLAATAEQTIHTAVRRACTIDPALRVSTQVRFGSPAEVIRRHGRSDSLIVLGREHQGLGRTARRVVGSVRPPVVMVNLGHQEIRGPATGLVVLVPSSRAGSAATAVAFRAALRRGVGLCVLHRTPRPNESGALSEYAQEFPEIDIRHQVLHDHTRERILAGSAGAALTVLDAAGRGRRTRPSHVARAVAGSACGPIVVVGHTTGDGPSPGSRFTDLAVMRRGADRS